MGQGSSSAWRAVGRAGLGTRRARTARGPVSACLYPGWRARLSGAGLWL